MSKIAIIGAGLAGSEAALLLVHRGIAVTLYEARPQWCSPAHITDLPAELVCSNSLKSQLLPSAHGLLKAELRSLESPLLAAAGRTAVPAGSALAVDREAFSKKVLGELQANPLITYLQEERASPPQDHDACIIAAGPLASEKITAWLLQHSSTGALHFYDAIAPIVTHDSIDFSIAFNASRWEEGEGDYVNCPFSETEYRTFYDALREADTVTARAFENSLFFESCLPVEVAAERGYKALAFGPLRPVGLTDPRTGKRPFAVCQLRQEQCSKESYNLVGFQTRLRIPEQERVFRLIPGLAQVEFLRYGSIHRNTYLDSPVVLGHDLSLRSTTGIFIAGQLCGSEGYTESIATGHLAARAAESFISGRMFTAPPEASALGALLHHVTAPKDRPFTPSNIHYGLFPPLELQKTRKKIGKQEKQEFFCSRALEALHTWRSTFP